MSKAAVTQVSAGTGISRESSPFEAGRAAAAAAVAPLDGETPSIVLVFATPRYDLPKLIRGVRSVTGDVLLVGCTGSGEICTGEYLGFGGGVTVLALAGGGYRFAAASRGDINGDLDAVGQALAREARSKAGPSPYAAALLITDSMLGNLQEFANGVYRVVGPKVAMVGGAAGDEQRFVESSVFHDEAIHHDGALVLWVASERPLRVVTRHGWQPMSPPVVVTRAAGTEIAELGGRPAASVFEEQVGHEMPASAFWPRSILNPFGLLQPDGKHVIRVARARDDDGVLSIHGCVPPVGSAVQVMSGSVDGLLRIDEEVVAEALGERQDAGVLLTFSCAARAFIFGERAAEESNRLQTAAGDVPVFGFYCCAEFARTAGTLATHNASLTAIAL